MNEEILRAMIRESIARHLPPSPASLAAARPAFAGASARQAEPSHAQPAAPTLEQWHALPFSAHPSHFRYTLPESSGPCYIEPGSHCSHCGYCESHGH